MTHELQWNHDRTTAIEGGLPPDGCSHFPLSGTAVTRWLQKYGIRPDMSFKALRSKVYDMIRAARRVRLFVLKEPHSVVSGKARAFVVQTVKQRESRDAKGIVVPVSVPSAYSRRERTRPMPADVEKRLANEQHAWEEFDAKRAKASKPVQTMEDFDNHTAAGGDGRPHVNAMRKVNGIEETPQRKRNAKLPPAEVATPAPEPRAESSCRAGNPERSEGRDEGRASAAAGNAHRSATDGASNLASDF